MIRKIADQLLEAFASSNLAVIDRLCADDLLLWGTDEGEHWTSKVEVLQMLDGAFDLSVRWLSEPDVHDAWLAGVVEFVGQGGQAETARVTMVFRGGLLEHAHYSVPH